MLKIIKTETDDLTKNKTTEVGNFPEDQAKDFILNKYTEFANDIINDHLKLCQAIDKNNKLELNKTETGIQSIQTNNDKRISYYYARKTPTKVYKTYYNKTTGTFFFITYQITKIDEK